MAARTTLVAGNGETRQAMMVLAEEGASPHQQQQLTGAVVRTDGSTLLQCCETPATGVDRCERAAQIIKQLRHN
jgi:hypothetical protein